MGSRRVEGDLGRTARREGAHVEPQGRGATREVVARGRPQLPHGAAHASAPTGPVSQARIVRAAGTSHRIAPIATSRALLTSWLPSRLSSNGGALPWCWHDTRLSRGPSRDKPSIHLVLAPSSPLTPQRLPRSGQNQNRDRLTHWSAGSGEGYSFSRGEATLWEKRCPQRSSPAAESGVPSPQETKHRTPVSRILAASRSRASPERCLRSSSEDIVEGRGGPGSGEVTQSEGTPRAGASSRESSRRPRHLGDPPPSALMPVLLPQDQHDFLAPPENWGKARLVTRYSPNNLTGWTLPEASWTQMFPRRTTGRVTSSQFQNFRRRSLGRAVDEARAG